MTKTRFDEIIVTSDELWMMMLSTIRYSMGRRSYIVAVCDDLVKKFAPKLEYHQLEQIAEEIEKEVLLCEGRNETLGMQMDHDSWKKTASWIRTYVPEIDI